MEQVRQAAEQKRRQEAERRRQAAAAQRAQAQLWAEKQLKKQVQFDWDEAIEEDQFQSAWKDAQGMDADLTQYNPIAAFGRSPVMGYLTQMLPWGMRGTAQDMFGVAGQIYDMLPHSSRRRLHQLGTRAAQITGGFVPRRLAPFVEGIGEQFGLSGVASRGIAGGAAALAAARMAGGNISQMSESGREIVGTLVKSIQSSMGDVAQAGRQITSVVASAVLSPFGQSGRAVGSIAESAVGGVAGIGGALTGGIGSMAGAAGGLIGTAAGVGVGALGAGAGALLGSVMGIGPLLGGAGGMVIGTFLGMLVGKVLSAIAQLFAGVLEAAGKVAGELGRVIASGIQAAIDIIKDTLDALMGHARRIREITDNSGLSNRTASGALMNAQALGIPPQDAVGMFRGNAMLQSGRQALIGATGEPGSAEFFLSAQQRYQQLLTLTGSPAIANQVFRSAGYGAMIPQMNMDPDLVSYGLGQSARMQGAFNLDPERIAQAGQQMEVLNGLFGQFVDLVKMKFAQELFPFLSGVLGRLIDYVSENSDKIVEFIQKSVVFLVEEVPPMIARSVAFTAGVLAQLAMLIGNFAEWLSDHLPEIASFFDFLIEKLSGFLGYLVPGSAGGGATDGSGTGSWGSDGGGSGSWGGSGAPSGSAEAAATAAAVTGGAGEPPQARRRKIGREAPKWVRYTVGAIGALLGAAAGGGGTGGPGAVPGGLVGYTVFANAANHFFGKDIYADESIGPEGTRAQKALRDASRVVGRSPSEGIAAQLLEFQKSANEFSENYQSEMRELLRGLDTTTKNLDRTLREGLDVYVETEYTLTPTDNFLAEATAKGSWAQWRKVAQTVG